MSRKIIRRTFQTLRQAKRLQDELCSEYQNVTLLRCPLYSEAGEYVWIVSRKLDDLHGQETQEEGLGLA